MFKQSPPKTQSCNATDGTYGGVGGILTKTKAPLFCVAVRPNFIIMRPILLAAFLLVASLGWSQDNPNYDPDFNDDGCYSIADILGLLPLFGSCEVWACGDPVNYWGYDYQTTEINGQCWFAENLRTEFYRNGDTIPNGFLTASSWAALDSLQLGATTVYGEGVVEGEAEWTWEACGGSGPLGDEQCNAELTLEVMGRLYNGYAFEDTRHLCPSGWHEPNTTEWANAVDSLALVGLDSEAWKSTDMWWPGSCGNNGTGFNGSPTGLRTVQGFFSIGINGWDPGGYWQTWYENLNTGSSGVQIFGLTPYTDQWLTGGMNLGVAVRCIMDE